jgi:hypothetical protein
MIKDKREVLLYLNKGKGKGDRIHALEPYRGVEIYFHLFLLSPQIGGVFAVNVSSGGTHFLTFMSCG